MPGHVATGADKVAVLIEWADGKRAKFELIYRVDTSAPRSDTGIRINGSRDGAVSDGRSWRWAQLATGNDVNCVTEITLWNGRIELRRGDLASAWSATINVPQNWRGQAAIVGFVLIGAAHNRTEIQVNRND